MASLTLRRLVRAVRDTRGAELLEFALVLPVLLLVVAGIIDMGFLFNNYQVVTNAAREGARFASIPGRPDADVEDRVKDYVEGAGLVRDSVETTITYDLIPAGASTINAVQVVVSYPYNYLILGPIAQLLDPQSEFDTLTLKGVATMRREVAAGL